MRCSLKSEGYDPWKYYHQNEMLREVLDSIRNDTFRPDELDSLRPSANRCWKTAIPI